MLPVEIHNATHTLFRASFAHIFYDPASHVLHAYWTGFLKPDETRRACKLMIDYLRDHQITSHLSDHTGLKVLSLVVQQQLIGNFFPEMERNGLKRMAVLLSEDVFAQATAENVITRACCHKMQIKTFSSSSEAINWLSGV